MNASRLIAAMSSLLVLGAAAAAAPSQTPFDGKDWAWKCPIQASAGITGFVRAPLTAEILEQSQQSLNDLRIVDAQVALAPHVLFRPPVCVPSERLAWRSVNLINRMFMPEGHASVTLDFGSAVKKNRIQVRLSETNYRRKALLEGSVDGVAWNVVLENQWLFDVSLTAEHFKVDTLSFPVNDFRFLRLTVYHMPDDPRRIEVLDVQAALSEAMPPKKLVPVEVQPRLVPPEEGESNETSYEFDLGGRNLPVDTLALRVSDPYFHRAYALFGRDAATERVTRPSEQGGQEIEREIPWQPVCRGVFYRVQESGDTKESLAVTDLTTSSRFLLLRIYNGDMQPLVLDGFDVKRRDFPSLVFEAKPGGQYTLMGGNPAAHAPSYDLGISMAGIAERPCPEVTLGPLSIQPKTPELAPWTERHRVLLWVALVLAAGVLLASTARSFIKIQRGNSP